MKKIFTILCLCSLLVLPAATWAAYFNCVITTMSSSTNCDCNKVLTDAHSQEDHDKPLKLIQQQFSNWQFTEISTSIFTSINFYTRPIYTLHYLAIITDGFPIGVFQPPSAA